MNENDIRTRLREAMGESDYPPDLTGRVTARLKQPPAATGRARMLGVVAGLLAALIVLSLVYVRVHSPSIARPSATAASLPAFVLQAANLTAAAPLITDPNLKTAIRGQTINLVGAYSDARNTVLVFRVLPATAGLGIGVWDDTGPMDPLLQMRALQDGYQYFQLYKSPWTGPDGLAHLNVSIQDPFDETIFNATSARRTFGDWSFNLDLGVHPGVRLPLQPVPTYIGSWKVSISMFQLTPSAIYLAATFIGPSSNEELFKAVTLTDAAGHELMPVGGIIRGGQTLGFWEQWERPAVATRCTLRIVQGTSQYATTVSIPAPGIMPSPAPEPAPSSSPAGQIPQSILDDAGLTAAAAVISHPNITQASEGRSLTLAAAYADPYRTVLIFHTPPPLVYLLAKVFDDAGPLTDTTPLPQQTSNGFEGNFAAVYVMRGPHAGAGGVAHMKVTVNGYEDPAQTLSETWTIAFDLKVQPASLLRLSPPPTAVGSWTVNVEAFELTPSGIYFQAVIKGDVSGPNPFGYVAMRGTALFKWSPIDPVDGGYRYRFYFVRPGVATTLKLEITGGGGSYSADVKIPAPPNS